MHYSGFVFRERSSKQEAAEIEFCEGKASISINGVLLYESVEIESIQNKKDIYLSNGVLFNLSNVLSEAQEKQLSSRLNKTIAFLEKFSLTKAIILSVMLISSLVFFRYAIIASTPILVSLIPNSWEEKIGNSSYQTLAKTVLDDSKLNIDKIKTLQNKAQQLAAANGLNSTPIFFHASKMIGANAMAFPAGPIVVTDDLVKIMANDDLIIAVIAHEFAHIQLRHSLYQMVEVSAMGIITALLLGSDESLIEEVSVIGIGLWASKKSRNFEQEADLLAKDYLKVAGYSADLFAQAIQKLTEYRCVSKHKESQQKCLDNVNSGWLSSHPTGAVRVKKLREE